MVKSVVEFLLNASENDNRHTKDFLRGKISYNFQLTFKTLNFSYHYLVLFVFSYAVDIRWQVRCCKKKTLESGTVNHD